MIEKGPLKLKKSLKINLSMHLAGVIERILTQSELTIQQEINLDEVKDSPIYPAVIRLIKC